MCIKILKFGGLGTGIHSVQQQKLFGSYRFLKSGVSFKNCIGIIKSEPFFSPMHFHSSFATFEPLKGLFMPTKACLLSSKIFRYITRKHVNARQCFGTDKL